MKEALENAKFAAGHECMTSKTPFAIVVVQILVDDIINIIACKLFGHNWVDGNPGDNRCGRVEFECTRCGESHTGYW